MRCFLCKEEVSNSTDPNLAIMYGKYQYSCKVCGEVHITRKATYVPSLSEQAYLLSGYFRWAKERGSEPVLVTTKNVDGLLDATPQNILEKVDKLLEYLGLKSDFYGQRVNVDCEADYPLAYAKNCMEMLHLVSYMNDCGYLEQPGGNYCILRVPGWQRLEELRRQPSDTHRCFVAMWFADELDSAYKNGIERAISDAGYQPIRVDQVEHVNKIDDFIIAEIRRCKFLVADFTGQRGGVYYEAGFAHGLGRPVIMLCKKDQVEKLHFDIRQYNFILWESPEELYKRLYDRIRAVIVD